MMAPNRITIRLSPAGLVTVWVGMVLAAGLLAYRFVTITHRSGDGRTVTSATRAQASSTADVPPGGMPPWGEITNRDIQLEQPEEFIEFEANSHQAQSWVFTGLAPEKVQALMQSCGVPLDQIARALSPPLVSLTPSNTVIHPDDELMFSLSPTTRAKLYGALSGDPANHHLSNPCCYPGGTFDALVAKSKVDPAVIDMVRKLLYPRGDTQCFSDFETVLQHVPSETDRLDLVRSLTRQSVLLAGLRIRPDTDIDKLLGYWVAPADGVRYKDVRPLLESLKRLQSGGSISLLYLLPPFARDRLNTFPLPPKRNDPARDSIWSTMNFFNATPDDRFADADYTMSFVKAHYYQIARPVLYGDLVFLLNDRGETVHSAVYLAEDIVFTKYGNNYTQPWVLMRMKNLVTQYTTDKPPLVMAFRRNET